MDNQRKAEINNCLLGIKNGEPDAVDKLYPLVAHSIRYISLKFLAHEEDACDLEQDFGAEIYRIAGGFNYFKNGFSYLCKVMTNMALNRYKKIYGERHHVVEVVDYNCINYFDENAVIENLDNNLVVQRAFTKLDTSEQKIMQLTIFEYETITQIAKELRMSKSQI